MVPLHGQGKWWACKNSLNTASEASLLGRWTWLYDDAVWKSFDWSRSDQSKFFHTASHHSSIHTYSYSNCSGYQGATCTSWSDGSAFRRNWAQGVMEKYNDVIMFLGLMSKANHEFNSEKVFIYLISRDTDTSLLVSDLLMHKHICVHTIVSSC